MNFFQITYREEMTEKFFTVIINKEMFSFEDALMRAEDEILTFDTSVNQNRLICIEAKIIINVIKVLQ